MYTLFGRTQQEKERENVEQGAMIMARFDSSRRNATLIRLGFGSGTKKSSRSAFCKVQTKTPRSGDECLDGFFSTMKNAGCLQAIGNRAFSSLSFEDYRKMSVIDMSIYVCLYMR